MRKEIENNISFSMGHAEGNTEGALVMARGSMQVPNPNGAVAQMMQLPNPNDAVAQMMQSPKWPSRPNDTVAQGIVESISVSVFAARNFD